MPTQWRRMLKKKYGITEAQYTELLNKQNGVCAICGSKKAGYKMRQLVIDHIHGTNKIRGLLCTPCNLGLGNFKDNIGFLENAASYLRRAQ